MNASKRDFLYRNELAAFLSVPWTTVVQWMYSPAAPPFSKRGNRIIYLREAVESWLENGGREWLARNIRRRNPHSQTEEERLSRHRINQARWREINLEKVRLASRESKRRDRRNNPERAREINRRYRILHPDAVRRAQVKTNYGIDYDATLTEQGYRCAACKCELEASKPRSIHVDHCHTTGRFRGILCSSCNKTLGHSHESISRLLSLIEYLEKSANGIDLGQEPEGNQLPVM